MYQDAAEMNLKVNDRVQLLLFARKVWNGKRSPRGLYNKRADRK